ncbi:sugar ABC transporter substrate-binding protein [Lederbergia sp. NSJ-179]|uniref:ABC transporter substrate-binding protein n=1 Tax=Lederbergia sp. NSJ-179 TaxID=2931402 RepID=UPI001FD0F2FA|nr:sugar ABC transporter substrate-binding protein [Lederbergia sp. NSJ-179]MCJ7842315.1 sugar ABC transporter substrate-binding protein [Lederbergia sp. NSJ-179]
MKKLFRIIVLGIVVAFVAGLVACSNANKEESTGSGGKKTEITYAIWDPIQKPGMEKIAEEFMNKNPNIHVKVQVIPWDQYWTKLEASANGQTLPDVFWMHGSEAHRYMKADVLLDITDSYKKVEGNFPEDLVDLYSYDGNNYGIPKDVSTVGLWYNKQIFDENGIAYPDESWDWDKFKEVAKQLTDSDKGIYGFAASNDTEVGYYNAIFQNEGNVISDDKTKSELNSPATQEALQWWGDFSLKDKSSPSIVEFAENNVRSLFLSGKIAMIYDGSWMYGEYSSNDDMKQNIDVAVLPKGKTKATVYNGLANSVSAYTENKDAAIKFVDFLSSKQGMEIQGESTVAIPAYKGTEAKFIEATEDTFNTRVFSEMLDYGVLRPNGPNFNKAETIATEELAKMFSGNETVEEATNNAAKKVNEILSN